MRERLELVMSESIHGHTVMQFMLQSEQGFNKASLKLAIENEFGAQAKFHTCSKKDMNSEGIISFLESKGKFVGSSNDFNTHAEKICNH
jgi:probable metal-binding protein